MAPYDLEKEEKAHFITPSLGSGQVETFNPVAIWAAVQSNSAHDDPFTFRAAAAVLGTGTPTNPLLPDRCNWHGMPRTVSRALGTVLL